MSPQPISSSQILDALRWRYATKTFDAQRLIPGQIWETLEDSLLLTPSSFGLQPYRVLVVEDPVTRELLLPHAWNQRQVVDASHFVVLAARQDLTDAEIDRHIQRIAAARGVTPESLAGYRGMMAGMLFHEDFKPLLPHWAARQVYLALGNLLTCAALLGIDACPMEGFVPAEFDQILELHGTGYSATVACALGYRHPDDKAARAPKVRLSKAEFVVRLNGSANQNLP